MTSCPEAWSEDLGIWENSISWVFTSEEDGWLSEHTEGFRLVHDVIHIPWSYFYQGFLFWHLRMTHPPRTRVNTCAQSLHLTNPCTKRNVLSLTKPKGRIYKTKSLGHYITITIVFSTHGTVPKKPSNRLERREERREETNKETKKRMSGIIFWKKERKKGRKKGRNKQTKEQRNK